MAWPDILAAFFRRARAERAHASRPVVLAMLAMLVLSGPAAAQARLALIIGNSTYVSVPSLENPVFDAALISQTLSSLGFATTLIQDADGTTMKRAIAEFGRTLREAGPESVGLFYYAGHGVQNGAGVNYLIPVDATLMDEADLPILAVEASWVLAQMESAGNVTNIVILDACRNNPFPSGSRAATRGLAPIAAPTGSFVAYSTLPGDVASDGTGENSPFTMALAENMMLPAIPIEQMFRQVRVDVLRKTGGAQTPHDSSLLVAEFAFNPDRADGAETALWTSVEASGEAKLVGLFLEVFPDGPHAAEARALLASLDPTGTVMERAEGEDTVGIVIRERPPGPLPADTAIAAYDQPFATGSPEIVGRTIEELVTGFALFSPMDGLDPAIWQTQRCGGCHQWTKADLCTQAIDIAAREPGRLAEKPHPYGVEFKVGLAQWASSGCR